MTTVCNNQQFQITFEEHLKNSDLKSEEIQRTSQEMTMMQQKSKQISLSSSSSSDIKNAQANSAYLSSNDDFPLTLWDALKKHCEISSVYDLLDPEHPFPKGVSQKDVLQKQPKFKKPTIMPYVKIRDLNNSENEPKKNKAKKAIEIGISFDF